MASESSGGDTDRLGKEAKRAYRGMMMLCTGLLIIGTVGGYVTGGVGGLAAVVTAILGTVLTMVVLTSP